MTACISIENLLREFGEAYALAQPATRSELITSWELRLRDLKAPSAFDEIDHVYAWVAQFLYKKPDPIGIRREFAFVERQRIYMHLQAIERDWNRFNPVWPVPNRNIAALALRALSNNKKRCLRIFIDGRSRMLVSFYVIQLDRVLDWIKRHEYPTREGYESFIQAIKENMEAIK